MSVAYNKTSLKLVGGSHEQKLLEIKSILSGVLQQLGDCIVSYEVIVRSYEVASGEEPNDFIIFGPLFCKMTICDIDGILIADELCREPIRGVHILAHAPKLKQSVVIASNSNSIRPVKSSVQRQQKREQDLRRRGRNIAKLREKIVGIPAPGGLKIFDNYRPLLHSSSTVAREFVSIDWHMVPQCLDPSHNYIANAGLGEAAQDSVKTSPGVASAADNIGEIVNDAINIKGDLTDRAIRKRYQAESFFLVLQQMLPFDDSPQRRMHIVDFGSGTGNLCLPLAIMFPQFDFTAVDFKQKSIDILLQRAAAAGLRNVRGVCGTIEEFNEPFDVSLALHACGQATDFALSQAERCRAAYIVCPCCIGKILLEKKEKTDEASGGTAGIICLPCISHPRSKWLSESLGENVDNWFVAMAKSGDISHGHAQLNSTFNPENEEVGRLSKTHLEMDRSRRMEEVGYKAVLSKVLKSELTSKGDMLIGVPKEAVEEGRYEWLWD